MRRMLVILLMAMLLAGCSGGLFSAPPKLEIEDVTVDWQYLPTLQGRVLNAGGTARYVELAVKLTALDDENHIFMTGWTNFSSFGAGESRPFSMLLHGERPTGQFKYHWRVSTTPGGAMY